ncbi:AEC family transporter [Aureimonas sp. AU40]|uniref:AEC family transporter n=1 Tax=Aureimonas sp. AU40 TaxID=1637747 RepID=UPI000784E10E|nr:AEC family transporter [Aureimonas sp. AU40]
MSLVLSIVAPIFILIGLGALVAKLKLLPTTTGEALTQFVFLVAVPALMFRTLATADFGEANPLFLWASYFAGVVPSFALGMVAARRLAGADRRTAVISGVSASFSNLIFVGIPVAERAFGREGLDVLALIISIHLPVMMTASTLLLERAALADARAGTASGLANGSAPAVSLRRTLGQIGRNLSRNALVYGLLGGALWRLTGLPLTGPVGEVLRLLSVTAGPIALFAVGFSLPRYPIRGALRAPVAITALALLVQPLAVLLVGSLLLPPLWLAVAVVAAASPTGVNAYLFATYFRAGEGLSAGVIVVSTVAAALTLTGWIALMTSV